ncbi:MAG: polyphosphate kinase 1, partial [Deltaproteobacteria bacterium]|nr:polyphosphate kinase 1 [Deltaproteobacteria bacterium]
VLAIKQTLYRTGADSPVLEALVEAARAGKEVTVVVELMARFDEAANIAGATLLQDVGANVVYGVVGYKTHAKMLMVVRREEDGSLRRFTHLGTGNYHHRTAKLYTDFGMITADPEIGADVHQVFMQLTSVGRGVKLERLLQSPFTLLPTMLELIAFEAEEAKAGRPARIIARMNALTDVGVMHALYIASRAGVQIDLIVRGVCCLRPGVPGLSENIRVRSVVGRFLEHSRAYWFQHGGEERLYLASADWMVRNLHRRVEVAFPVDDPVLKQRVIDEGLQAYLDDNRQSWEMNPDGSYGKVKRAGDPTFRAQSMLLERLGKLGRAPAGDAGRRRKADRKKNRKKSKRKNG